MASGDQRMGQQTFPRLEPGGGGTSVVLTRHLDIGLRNNLIRRTRGKKERNLELCVCEILSCVTDVDAGEWILMQFSAVSRESCMH